jgi:hypothetical protein
MIKIVMYLCLALAVIAAVFYILLGVGVVSAGDVSDVNAPPGIAYVAAAGYIIGGCLILLKKRGLWITGFVINSLVIIIFFTMHASRPWILSSVPGLATKLAQILLEAGLIYLILKAKPEKTAK